MFDQYGRLVVIAQVAAGSGCDLRSDSTERSVECDAHCRKSAYRLINESAGTSNVENVEISDVAFQQKLSKVAAAGGATMSKNVASTIERSISQSDGRIAPPLLLIGNSSHYFWLHGAFTHSGATFYAVRHGENPIVVLDEGDFASIKPHSVWQSSSPHQSQYVNFLSGSQVTISPPVCDVGLLQPLQHGSATVVITNSGANAIEFEDIATSCGCTNAVVEGGKKVLLPNEQVALVVTLKASIAVPKKERVFLTIRDSAAAEKTTVEVVVLAYQLPISTLSKKELQFGPVRQGETAASEFRLAETIADRFTVSSVDGGNPSVNCEVDTVKIGKRGLNEYRVRCHWETENMPPGKHQAAVRVQTTSDWTPAFVLQATLSVRPDIRIHPEKLLIGDLVAGVEHKERVMIELRHGTVIQSITPMNVRPEMTATVDPQQDAQFIPISISCRPTNPGQVDHTLIFMFKTSSGTYAEKLPISVMVHSHSTAGIP